MRTDELNETDPTHAPDEGAPDETAIEPVTPGASTETPEPQEPEAAAEPEAVDPEPEPVEPEAEIVEPAAIDEIEAEADDGSIRVESEGSLEAAEASDATSAEADGVEADGVEADAEVVEPEAEPPAPEPQRASEPETADEPTAAPVDDDPFRGHGDWYVVHTYS